MSSQIIIPQKDYCAFVIVVMPDGKLALMNEKGFSQRKWKLFGGRPKEEDKENGLLRPENTAMREVPEEGGIHIAPIEGKAFFVRAKTSPRTKIPFDFIVFIGHYSQGALFAAGDDVAEVKAFTLQEIEEMIARNEIVSDHAEALTMYINKLTNLRELVDAFCI